MKYKVIALMGKSGSGKDTVMQNFLKTYPNYSHEIISCTSRPAREGEVEGKNYFFLSAKIFEELYNSGKMLEATSFNGWYYGTNKDSLEIDTINIGVFNPEGIRSLIKNPEIEVIIFEIICPNKTRLLRQLNREENPKVEEIIRRYNTDEKDFGNLEFNSLKVQNENKEDLYTSAKYIYEVSKAIFSQGQSLLKE